MLQRHLCQRKLQVSRVFEGELSRCPSWGTKDANVGRHLASHQENSANKSSQLSRKKAPFCGALRCFSDRRRSPAVTCLSRGRLHCLTAGFVLHSESTAVVNKNKSRAPSPVPSQSRPATLAKIRGRFRGNVPFAACSGRGHPSSARPARMSGKVP